MEHCSTPVTDARRDALYEWAVAQVRQLTPFQPAASLTVVSGDASFRRYFRLAHDQGSLIAVDAPPERENSRGFVAIAQALHAQGVQVPEVLAVDLQQGYMLLSDLGDTLLNPCLNAESVDDLYDRAGQQLLRLLACPPPTDYPLLTYDHSRLHMEMSLFREWFVERYLGLTLSAQEQDLLAHSLDVIAADALSQPVVFVHRDFHSRNLMLLASGEIAVIDFQDAATGPISYDLMSLLRDAYIEWPAVRVDGWIERFYRQLQVAGKLSAEVQLATFRRWCDLISAQRHLKVLGIFCRLSLRDGKHGYLGDLPLVLRYLCSEIQGYPELQPLADWLQARIVPAFAARQTAGASC